MSRGIGLLSLLVLLSSCLGCQTVRQRRTPPSVIQPPADVPRELCKATVPEYIIEPPDILTIEAIGLLPRQPYLLQPLDSISVQVIDSAGESLYEATTAIEPGGKLPIGPIFGAVEAQGKTIDQLREDIRQRVLTVYEKPLIAVDLVQLGLLQQIAGEHLVTPAGKVNLGVYGQVRVAGMTLPEATEAVETHLEQHLADPQIAIDVFGYNSKYYYVITQGAGLGDQVNRFPCTGNETVLDAISNVEGLSALSSQQMWIARPGRNEQGGEQILPVDWSAISMRGDVNTNYQLLPGDRLFIAEDGLVAYDNRLAKKLAPVERVAGVTLLITQTLQRLVFFEQSGIRGGGFGGGF